jgi:UDP-N-acetylglucosamine 3-dehydrogenase
VARTDRRINLAVIGAGYWGKKVIGEYLELENVDADFNLAKVCDIKDENLIFCKEKLKLGKEKLSSQIEDVLNSSDINAVHICTPNETHHLLASLALYSGKNVLLEKPMSLSAKEASNLCDIAQAECLTLQVGHIYRFNSALKKTRKLLFQNVLGQLYYVKMQWTTLMPSQLNRDIIFDLGPHPVDIVNYLLGEWPHRVSCNARAYRKGTSEEVAYLMMEFSNNVLAHIELSWLQPGTVREVNLIGSKGTATIDCLGQTIRVCEDNEHYCQIDVKANNTIYDEIAHFIRSIRDENNHKNPGSIGASNVAVLESLKEAKAKDKLLELDWMSR